MKVIGIDLGLTGALAVVETIGGVPTLLAAVDMPTTGTGKQRRVDAHALAAWVRQHGPAQAFIEQTSSRPGQGVASSFQFGRCTGAIETTIALCEIPTTYITPATWKRKLHLNSDKEQARQRAIQLFPNKYELLSRKKDQGRAEAALIALIGANGDQSGI